MTIFYAILFLAGLALLFGVLLGFAAVRFRVDGNPVVDQIDEILPQSQCGKCGYPGCHPYAEAVARGEAPINLCPPGGENGMLALANLLGVEPLALDENATATHIPKRVAVIDETLCIGCTLCIKACPVDAIVGTNKMMHTVIEQECTGCELCLPPCPVDCIAMVDVPPTLNSWTFPYPVYTLHPQTALKTPPSVAANTMVEETA